MRRAPKILMWTVGIIAALIVVAWFGLKIYLNSSSVRQMASTQLSEAIGLPVQVEELSVGAGSTTAALRIPDTEAGEDLLRIGSLNTDISLSGLLTGRVAPTTVTLGNVDFLFRIDAENNILSPLPKLKEAGSASGKTVPAVQITSGRVRIRQTGKPEFTLTGVSGQLRREGDGYALTGDVNDPAWGKWRINGRLAADPADGQIELSTEQTEYKDSLLHTIPYVPPMVWEHLSASGPTAAKVTFTFRPGADLGYAVELKPQRATLTVPDAGVKVTQVDGLIRVADGKVTVSDGSVSLADGTVSVGGVYTFDQSTAVIAMKLAASGVNVRRLPETWGLPKEIEGKLKGDANLELHINPEGKLDTRGSGQGVVEGAKFAGLDAEIKLKLSAQNGRYKFDNITPVQ